MLFTCVLDEYQIYLKNQTHSKVTEQFKYINILKLCRNNEDMFLRVTLIWQRDYFYNFTCTKQLP